MSEEKQESRESAAAPAVEEIMISDVPVVNLDENVKNAAALMEKKGYGCLIVLDHDIALGIVTESDIVLKVTAEGIDPSKVLALDIMSSPLIGVIKNASILEAAEKMRTFNVRKIAVIDDGGRLVGLITSVELARWLSAQNDYSDVMLDALAKLGPVEGGPYG
jgi:CBS domain-containing protein